MKSKILVLILTLFILVGCNGDKDDTSNNNSTNDNTNTDMDSNYKYKDGTYSEEIDGYASSFNLEITIKDDKITAVNFGENKETPSIGGVALTTMKERILENQFDEPDVVSGATVTSEAVIDAFQRILEDAKSKE